LTCLNRIRQRWQKPERKTDTGLTIGEIRSKIAKLKSEVFDVGATSDPAKFSKSLKSIENYIQMNYKTCDNIMKAIQQLNRPTLKYPKKPTRANHTDASENVDEDKFKMVKFAWKEDYKGMKY
jgi:hypothetical protein